MAKGSQVASLGLNGEPTPPCARFLTWKPFAINAASIDYLDTLLGVPISIRLLVTNRR